MNRTVTLPASAEDAIESLDGIGRLMTAKGWERAALIYCLTEPQQGARTDLTSSTSTGSYGIEEFAKLGIAGLKSGKTVRLYRQRWEEHGNPDIKLGDTIDLPHDDWPSVWPTRPSRGYESEQGLTTTLKKAVTTHGATGIAAAIADLPDDTKEQVARELAQDATVRSEAIKAGNHELTRKRTDARDEGRAIDPNPRTSLDGIALIHDLKTVERTVTELAADATEENDEVQALVALTIAAITAQLDMIQSKVEGRSWDEALKELA